MLRVITSIMRATGRPPYSHRDPSRPGRGGDRLDLSIGAIAARLMSFRSSVSRRIIGAQPSAAEQAAPQSWLTAPSAMLGRVEPSLTTAPWADHEPPAYDIWTGESRIDLDASSPGVLVRTPRRPEDIAPQDVVTLPVYAAPPPPQQQQPATADVRYTRTPDSILIERRQRALEAEQAAQRQIEALREAEATALAAAKAAREAALEEARMIEEQMKLANAQSEASGRRVETQQAGVRPFVPPPGVRYFRTPDRPRVKPVAAALPAPVPTASPWSILPNWSAPQSWYGAIDDDAVSFWFPQEDEERLVAAAREQIAAIVAPAPAPKRPVSALERLTHHHRLAMRPAVKPLVAEVALPEFVQPPVNPILAAMAARAAIKPATAISAIATAPARPAPTPLLRPALLRRPKPAAPIVTDEPDPVVAEIESEIVAEEITLRQQEAEAPANLARPAVGQRSTIIPAPRHLPMPVAMNEEYALPSLELLAEPDPSGTEEMDADELEQNALNLQQTVQDFGVRGDILAVRPGPVVTLYELEPAPGTKSSRVIGLSDDIARSMSAVSARVAVVPGRNVIGIELPNPVRETVYLRELLSSEDFTATKQKLALCLGKNIGGEPIIADLARMPHLLVAGTTGSGKSVAINTMILSLLYRLTPEECRLIMVDPKMLELSVYDGIPHLLSPVVTDPKKAVIALKWAVREMEERYKKMAKVCVRNIDGFNARMKEAREKGELITRTIQTGFNRETGEAVFEEEAMDLAPLPYIVIVVDEMADLMMVAGKDIEGAIQRLAQMARAAGIHLIMATQRPSVDVITGTIKANFPTRISFQVTSKIDSRTILGEMGAEQLLGQGDMLFMAGGGRTTRVHGPFCSDSEVESVVAHLKAQGRPAYLEAVTADDGSAEPEKAKGKGKTDKDEFESEDDDAAVFDVGAFVAASGGDSADLYDQAIAVVLRDKKASTSYIQRRLQIGYNRAASIMERMENEGIVGPANHAGKREILVDSVPMPSSGYDDD